MSIRKYNEFNKTNAKSLRVNQSLPERILWFQVLSKNNLGIRFSRQIKIDNFIVDFCNLKYKLIIELDGNSHNTLIDKDSPRDKILADAGFKVIRILNSDVLDNLDSVCLYLRNIVEQIKNNSNNTFSRLSAPSPSASEI